MSVLRRNVVANVLGQSVGLVSGIVLMPIYAHVLGKESFGLLGFFLSLQAAAMVLDLGLAAAANREVSRRAAGEGGAGSGRDVVRTLEVVYYAMAAIAFAVLASAASWVAAQVIRAEQLPVALIRDCMIVAAATIGLRFAGALYHGVLRGLERQVTLNLYAATLVLVQTATLAAVLLLLRPPLFGFLLWQLGFAVAEILVLRFLAWRELGVLGRERATFRTGILREIWRYALSVNVISMFAAGIKQIDKIVISSLLPIGMLGYYSAAALAANGIGKVAVPVQTALFPRFARLHARGDDAELARLFRDSVRLLSLLSSAVAAVFVFFASDVLRVWMLSQEAADVGARPLSILAAAMMFNGVMAPVFSLVLATGYTQISLAMNAAGFVVLVPATFLLVERFGLPGAAMAWLGFNLAYYAIVPGWLARLWPFLSLRRFYLVDSAPFLLVSCATCSAFSWLAAGLGPYPRIGVAMLAGVCSLGLGLLISPPLRQLALAAWPGRL
jgi:O-antigen/teichoic acid export membrane protein